MKSGYRRIGDFIRLVDERNRDLSVTTLLGLSIDKVFIPSVANIVGSDMANYKIIRKGQFSCSLMQVRRDKKIPVALLRDYDEAIISQAYPVFEIIDQEQLLPEYLMMWMSRSEFDRHACFLAVGGVRGSLEWEDFCDMELPVPLPEKQKEIVREYNIITDRIKLNEDMDQKLEETAQALYRHWFVDFEFPGNVNIETIKTGDPDFPVIPKGWEIKTLEKITSKIGSGATPRGGKAAYKESGVSLVRSTNIHDYNFLYEDLAFISDDQAKKLDNVTLEEKDVLINITGVSVARCYMVPPDILPARVNQHVAIIRLKENYPITHYLLCALCSTDYKSRLLGISDGGSTRQALTKADLEECKVLLPSRDIRESFEEIVEKLFSYKNTIAIEKQNLLDAKHLLLASLASKKDEKRKAA